MLTRRVRPYAWLVLIFSLAAGLYCFAALGMVASLSGAPNYLGNARQQAVIWETGVLAALIVAVGATIVLIRTRQSEN